MGPYLLGTSWVDVWRGLLSGDPPSGPHAYGRNLLLLLRLPAVARRVQIKLPPW